MEKVHGIHAPWYKVWKGLSLKSEPPEVFALEREEKPGIKSEKLLKASPMSDEIISHG